MPLRVTFFLEPLGGSTPGFSWIEVFRTLLSRLVRVAGIPQEVVLSQPRPFTFSPLLTAAEVPASRKRTRDRPTNRRPREASDPFRLGMSWLLDSHVNALLKSIHSLREEALPTETNGRMLRIRGAATAPTAGDEWSRWIPYDRIFEEASSSLRTIVLRFCSPTLLHRSGVPYPLPDPAIIFRDYLERWNAFSALPLSVHLQSVLQDDLRLADFRIRRRPLPEGQAEAVGFGGSAIFRLAGRHPESVLKELNALADYALFCGTGTGTDHGMGLTRRVLRPRS